MQLLIKLRTETATCQSFVDLGCGFDGRYVEQLVRIKTRIGVDVFPPTHSPTGVSYIKSDIRTFDLSTHSPDTVTLLDVVEHLPKSDGVTLLHNCQLHSRKVIVFTPRGFLSQPPAEDNPYQEHLSGWNKTDLDALGFSTSILRIQPDHDSLYAIWNKN